MYTRAAVGDFFGIVSSLSTSFSLELHVPFPISLFFSFSIHLSFGPGLLYLIEPLTNFVPSEEQSSSWSLSTRLLVYQNPAFDPSPSSIRAISARP